MTVKTENKNEAIKLMIVEDYKLTRLSLKAILNTKENLNVVADAENATDAIQYLQMYKPDVVLMDIGLPGMSGIDATLKSMKVGSNMTILKEAQNESKRYLEYEIDF